MIVQVRQQCVKAGLSELETMKCHAALSTLETALQAECSVYQKDERPVYCHLWYYAKLWENNQKDLPKETEWVH